MNSDVFVPPQMPEFPRTCDELISVMAPYHRDRRLIDLFFEFLVVDVVGKLPEETHDAIADFAKQTPPFHEAFSGGWQRWVREKCHLSATIDTAILDLWYHNGDNAKAAGWSLESWYFAQIFTANYFMDGSMVDIWRGNALEMARVRITSREASQ
jgi:hypothetical protein